MRAPVETRRYWFTLVVVVSRLGAGPRMRVKMLAIGLWLPLRDRLLGQREFQLRLRYGRCELPWWVGSHSDFAVLNEVLVAKIYGAVSPLSPPRTILDLGSHIGASVLFWHERFPDARIIAVEPDPMTFRRLERNVGRLSGVEVRQAAIAREDGPQRFVPAKQGWVSSLEGHTILPGPRRAPIIVPGITLSALVAELGHVDLLKVDIEGAEHDALAAEPLRSVDAVVGEFHDAGDVAVRERFFEVLRGQFALEVDDTGPFIAFAGVRSPRQARSSPTAAGSGGSDRSPGDT